MPLILHCYSKTFNLQPVTYIIGSQTRVLRFRTNPLPNGEGIIRRYLKEQISTQTINF